MKILSIDHFHCYAVCCRAIVGGFALTEISARRKISAHVICGSVERPVDWGVPILVRSENCVAGFPAVNWGFTLRACRAAQWRVAPCVVLSRQIERVQGARIYPGTTEVI